MLGPDAVDHRAPLGHAARRRPAAAPPCASTPAAARDAADQVHRRRADELGDEQVRRPVVELERRPDLLDAPGVHHHDLVGHRHRLDLVVGDEDRRRLQPLVQLLDLRAHLHAELGVEVGERLVEQEHLRVAHDRAAHRHPLPLPARELPRIALEIAARARGSPPPARPGRRSRPCRCGGASARSPCSPAPSCADRARSSGTPWRCRARRARGCSPPARRCGSCRR